MTEPLVCAIMLTKDRPAMAKRAVECWKRQTYKNSILAIFDTSIGERLMPGWKTLMGGGIQYLYAGDNLHWQAASIGELRNYANMAANAHESPVIIHWDDDDYSHPNRISEQVTLLQASGKQCVGYLDMLFWKSDSDATFQLQHGPSGEAWLYHNNDPRYCLGTSLCYWRSTWERKPFPDQPRPGKMTGEDTEWIRDLDRAGVTSLVNPTRQNELGVPRIIASIHGGNSSGQYADIARSHNWKRVPQWDSYCRERMTL